MRRRSLVGLMGLVPFVGLPAWGHRVGEVRAGVPAGLARGMAGRLGVPVRAVGGGLVGLLDAGHLEVALLDAAGVAAARRLMGERLLVAGRRGEWFVASRAVLDRRLVGAMVAALA